MLLPKPVPKPFEALNQEVIPDTSLGLLEKQQLAKDEAIRNWLSDKPIVGLRPEQEDSAEEGASYCNIVARRASNLQTSWSKLYPEASCLSATSHKHVVCSERHGTAAPYSGGRVPQACCASSQLL